VDLLENIGITGVVASKVKQGVKEIST